VYVPNAGYGPTRDRLDYKLAFLAEMRAKMDSLVEQGKQASLLGASMHYVQLDSYRFQWHPPTHPTHHQPTHHRNHHPTLPRPLKPPPNPTQVIAVGDFNVPATQADFYTGFGCIDEVYDARELDAIRGEMRWFNGG